MDVLDQALARANARVTDADVSDAKVASEDARQRYLVAAQPLIMFAEDTADEAVS